MIEGNWFYPTRLGQNLINDLKNCFNLCKWLCPERNGTNNDAKNNNNNKQTVGKIFITSYRNSNCLGILKNMLYLVCAVLYIKMHILHFVFGVILFYFLDLFTKQNASFSYLFCLLTVLAQRDESSLLGREDISNFSLAMDQQDQRENKWRGYGFSHAAALCKTNSGGKTRYE